MPFGPGADELRRDCKTAEKSVNEGGLVEVVKEIPQKDIQNITISSAYWLY